MDCFHYGDACPQKGTTGLDSTLGVKPSWSSEDDIGQMGGPDCLNLAVLTPLDAIRAGNKLPVMVWIHGGSNVMCSNKGDFAGFSPTACAAFVERGIVCVSLNYRLALFGFLHLAEKGITNLALRDLICGLQYVKKNIGALGGDPDNVTIVGESAGAVHVSCLLGCPKAQGLFRRAIVQSGGPALMKKGFYEESVFPDFVESIERSVGQKGVDLASLTWEQLHKASLKLEDEKPLAKKRGCLLSPPVFQSVVDEDLFGGKTVVENIADGCSAHVDVLLGSLYCEPSLMSAMLPKSPLFYALWNWLTPKFILEPAVRGVGFGVTKSEMTQHENSVLPKAVKDLIAGFDEVSQKRVAEEMEYANVADQPAKSTSWAPSWSSISESSGLMQAMNYLFGCGGIACNSMVQQLAKTNGNLFIYTLKLSEFESPKMGSSHISDLPLLFTMDGADEKKWMDDVWFGGMRSNNVGLDELASGMQSSWASFIKGGHPSSFNEMEWPSYPAAAMLKTPFRAPRTAGEADPGSLGPSIQQTCSYAEGSLESTVWEETMAQHGIRSANAVSSMTTRKSTIGSSGTAAGA